MRLMNNKRVLLVSPFFFPELISTGKYNLALAIALRTNDVDVDVIASHPLYPDWKPNFSDATIDGIHIMRGGHMLRYPSNVLLRRAVLELWFSFHVFRRMAEMKRKHLLPDIIVPVFPPSLFFIFCPLLLSEKMRKVGIVHDLQGIYAASKKGLLARLVGKAIHFVEGKGFSNCDKLVFLSGEMMEEAIDAYKLDRNRCDVIYPPASLKIVDGSIDSELEEYFPDGFRHVVYSGALGDKQNPEGLAELFCQAIHSMEAVMFHFFSRGSGFDKLKGDYADKTNLIQFHDLVDEEQLQELYQRSDVQILPQRAGTSKGSLPSKLPNLIVAGVRVLAITDESSELESILSTVDGAIVINSWSENDFVSALNSVLNDSSSQIDRRSNNAALIRDKFSTEALVEAVLGVQK